MPRSGAILEATVSYYSKLASTALQVMRETQEELRIGQFQTEKAVARGLSLWLDSLEGLWSAVLVSASGPLPNVFVRLAKSSTTETVTVPMSVPTNPQFTGLKPIGGGAAIDDQLVSVRKGSKGDSLEVKLTGVSASKRPAPGLYFGLAHIADAPIATVMVLVEDPSTKSSASDATVKT